MQLFHRDKLQLVVALVAYRTRFGRAKEGVCSAWLRELPKGSTVPLWLRRGTIRLNPVRGRGPEWWRPMLCVGPGTGVAPMRALIHRRAALRTAWLAGQGPGPEGAGAREASLFFGCRHRDQDFFYKNDWSNLVAGGQLNRLYVAFSRDSESLVLGGHGHSAPETAAATGSKSEGAKKKKKKKKVYVQHLIAQHSARVWAALSPQAGGFCYVAGDVRGCQSRNEHHLPRFMHSRVTNSIACYHSHFARVRAEQDAVGRAGRADESVRARGQPDHGASAQVLQEAGTHATLPMRGMVVTDHASASVTAIEIYL